MSSEMVSFLARIVRATPDTSATHAAAFWLMLALVLQQIEIR